MPGVNPYPTIPGIGHEIQANKPQAVSMFRASPWVTYEPTNQSSILTSNDMDQDVDMDAPQISTLRDEESPPPPPKASSSNRRGKSSKAVTTWPRPRRKEIHTDDEYDEVEEEEDQLIDDDDDELMKPVPAAALPNPSRSGDASKRKTSSKRKPRKSEKRIAEDDRKAQEKAMLNQSGLAPTLSWFDATPSEPADDVDVKPINISAPVGSGLSKAGSPKKAPKKLAGPRIKLPSKLKTAVSLLVEDTGVMSEGYTGTAASSPVTLQFELNTPEPDGEPSGSALLVEETNLENVPLPQYPLPTKPFPVQNPPKIATGFAPVLPLDKSGKKVRHWRISHREVRGIAGGRWFARSWVGEKESEYASTPRPKGGDDKVPGVALPRLAAVSISAPIVGKGSGKGKGKVVSKNASTAPSRSGSSIPDIPPPNARPPTKMRTIIAPPSEGGDSDMVAPTGS